LFLPLLANDQANPTKTLPEPLQKAMRLKIPQTFKEANGFGSGLAACYGFCSALVQRL